jgi:hypothetical protein
MPRSHGRVHSRAADLWSAGVLLFYLVFLCHPFVSGADLATLEHERDMLRHIFASLGWPARAWIAQHVDPRCTDLAEEEEDDDGGGAATKPSRRRPPFLDPDRNTAVRAAAVRRMRALIARRTGVAYAEWEKRHGAALLGAIVDALLAAFRYEPAHRCLAFAAVQKLARVRALPDPGDVALAHPLLEAPAPTKKTAPPWFERERRRLPPLIAAYLWSLWHRWSPAPLTAVAPPPLDLVALLSLATKFAGFRDDLRFVAPQKAPFDAAWLRAMHTRQHTIVRRTVLQMPGTSTPVTSSSSSSGSSSSSARRAPAASATPMSPSPSPRPVSAPTPRGGAVRLDLRSIARPSPPPPTPRTRRPPTAAPATPPLTRARTRATAQT